MIHRNKKNAEATAEQREDHAERRASTYWLVRDSKSIIFLILLLAFIGAFFYFSIPVSVFPNTNFPRILIAVDNGVMPIDQMLVTITRPIEETVNSVPGLQEVRSITSRGTAEVDLFFDWKVDMFVTLQRVDSALARLQPSLPSTVRIDAQRLTFASFPILGYSLTSDTIPQTSLWEIATYDMKPRLNRLNGVSTVTVQGGQVPEFQIMPDPAKLLRASVTIPEILNAVQQTNLVESPGLLETNHKLTLELVNGQVQNPNQISDIVIKNTPAGVPIRIADIATVTPSIEPLYTIVTADEKPAVLININRQPDSNTVAVANEVHAEIDNLRSALPPGIQLKTFYDQSTIVNESIKSVRDAIVIGIILAFIMLLVFLRDWGSSIVAGLVIPVTILLTFIVLKMIGESFNLMTLGGLAAAVGLVIDDAIVVVENIVLHRDAGERKLQAIQNALREIKTPLVASTITPVVVFLPLITITGVTGSFFRALAITMSAALLCSLALALTWTPNLSQYFLGKKKKTEGEDASVNAEASDAADLRTRASATTSPTTSQTEETKRLLAAEEASMRGFFGKIIARYERWLKRALDHPWWMAGFAVLLIAASYLCYRTLGSDLLPTMDEGSFVVDYIMPAGSSLQETNRVVEHVEDMIRAIPEVETTARRTGLQLGLAAVTEANTGDISVKLKSNRNRGIDATIADVRSKINEQEPALHVEFVQILQDLIGDLTSAPQPIDIKLFSSNAELLRDTGPRVAEAIKKIPGVVDVLNGIENTISGPANVFQVKTGITARTGFTPQEVATDAAAIVQGAPAATPVITNNHAYTLRVRFPNETRASQESMSNTLLVSSKGTTATLGALADMTTMPGQVEIRRDNLQRDVAVTGLLQGIDLGTAITNVKKAVADLHLPSSIRVEYGGTYQTQQQSFRSLMLVLLVALVLVFLVLLFEFKTFSAPVAVLCSAVLSTSGVFFALFVTATTFNIASFMGLIMVIGIVSKNGILLLDADQKFRAAGMAPEEAMIQAGRRRLRPIVMTALAAVVGMLPLALAIGSGSQMLQPLAIAVIGGILISMGLSLIITPAVHFYMSNE